MTLISGPKRSGRTVGVRVERPSERRSLSRSATRALDVLEYFGEMRRPLRAFEIARELDLSASTADQLLKTMVGSAHLRFDARGMTYQPSPRLVGFSHWVVDTYGALGRLDALIRTVREETGLTTTLTTPNDLFMQVIDMATPDWLPVERGQRVSIFGSATGSAYLATLDDAGIRRLAERARVSASEEAELFVSLAAIRRDGFADGANTSASATEVAISSLATSLPGTTLPFPIVLGLAGPAERMRIDRQALYLRLRRAIGRHLEAPATEHGSNE